MSIRTLRKLIRRILETKGKEDDLLLEPDETPGREETEQSVVAGIAGYTGPLGAGPRTTLAQRASVAGKSFGGAKEPRRKKKNNNF